MVTGSPRDAVRKGNGQRTWGRFTLPNLVDLDLGYSKIATLDGIPLLTSLVTLLLSCNQVSDVATLAGFTGLADQLLHVNPVVFGVLGTRGGRRPSRRQERGRRCVAGHTEADCRIGHKGGRGTVPRTPTQLRF